MSSSEMIHHENPSVMFLGEIGLFVRDRTPIKHVEIKGRDKALQPTQKLREWGGNYGTCENRGKKVHIYC